MTTERRFADLTIATFSEALAADTPTPGGGSASAVAGSLAASLLAMVARLSLGREKYAPFAATIERSIEVAERARVRLLELADLDAAAFEAWGAARRMPHGSLEEGAVRDAAVAAAALRAAEVPLEIVRECDLLADQVERASGRTNLHASSDLDVASLLVHAAARGAGANVIVNMPGIRDRAAADRMLHEVETRLHAIEATVARIRQLTRSGTLRHPE
jgi:glutamate formiminotransferase/formiminotetrahydrofolate cyclodeaminase